MSGWKPPGVYAEGITKNNLWLRGGALCAYCGGPFDKPTYYDVHFEVQSTADAHYGGVAMDVCSLDCAERQIQQAPKHAPRLLYTEGNPTDPALRGEVWIYAFAPESDYPEDAQRSGKWLVFADATRIDAVWQIVRGAVLAGKLGASAKVSTKPGSKNREGIPEHAICVYTYDSDDETDVWRIRQVLRDVGITWKLYYKTDEATLQGHYSGGGQRVSKYSG